MTSAPTSRTPRDTHPRDTGTDEVTSSFQRRPAYRYIRRTDKLPAYVEVEDRPLAEIECKVRLFNPTGSGTWWIAAYDPGTGVAWGVADIVEREVGSFSMEELVAYRGRFGLPIERDLHYTPVSIAHVVEGGRPRWNASSASGGVAALPSGASRSPTIGLS